MQKTLSTLKDKINNALVVDRENHIYRCHRSIFTDHPVTFENMLHFKFKQLRVGKYRAMAAVNMIFTVDN